MTVGSEDLFVYGTLQFPQVLEPLLGRVPSSAPARAHGWRAAALAGRVYPGLVPAEGVVRGVLLSGLSASESRALDEFEHPAYEVRSVELLDGGRARAYVWRGGDVLDHDWDATAFVEHELPAYAARLG